VEIYNEIQGTRSQLLLLVIVTMLLIIVTYYYYYYYYYYCPSNKHCPSARCAYAANVVGKDLDIFAVGAVSLYHIL
jgi:hypothetical protein